MPSLITTYIGTIIEKITLRCPSFLSEVEEHHNTSNYQDKNKANK